MTMPDRQGRFGDYGGRYAPETLMPALLELEEAFGEAWADPEFRQRLDALLRDFVGRPTPLYEAQRLSERLGFRLRERSGALRSAGPMLGEHNRDVLGGILGLGDDEIERLAERGVVR